MLAHQVSVSPDPRRQPAESSYHFYPANNPPNHHSQAQAQGQGQGQGQGRVQGQQQHQHQQIHHSQSRHHPYHQQQSRRNHQSQYQVQTPIPQYDRPYESELSQFTSAPESNYSFAYASTSIAPDHSAEFDWASQSLDLNPNSHHHNHNHHHHQQQQQQKQQQHIGVDDSIYSEDIASPPIRIHESTPAPEDLSYTGNSQGHEYNYNYSLPWESTPEPPAQTQLPVRPTPSYRPSSLQTFLQQANHKRNSSASTIASVGPASPFTPASSSPGIVDNDTSYCPSPNFDFYDGLPNTSCQQNKVLEAYQRLAQHPAPSYHDYSTPSINDARLQFMTRSPLPQAAIMAQEDVENSVNGKSNGTGTPSLAMNGRTTSDELGEEYRMARDSRSIIPKFDRTMSDICQDELYNPDAPLSAPTSQPRQNQSNLLSPFRGVFSERLQEANHARSGPPPADSTRSRSPFRQGFEFAGDQQLNGGGKPVTRFGSESALREQQKAKSDADALQQQQSMNSPNMQIEPTTVSPKEVKLDYQETEEDAKMLLFPRSPRAPASKSQAIQASPLARTELSQPPPAKRRNLSTSNNSFRSSVRQLSSESSTQSQNNAQMHAASTQPPQIPHQYPFIPQLPSQASSLQALTNRDPEFPAHLTSMETSKSDATSRTSTNGGHRSSGGSTSDGISTTPQITRPASTTADSGTYSCTFHGCAQRFNSAIKLNKHRREGHRDRDRQSSTPYSTGTSAMNMDDGGSGSVSGDDGDEGGNTSATSSAAGGGGGLNSGASRNSQAGPHRCSQINPSTGKPCNSIFSRPYDLTRHEDTIHNSRKQKVRCTLCAEEKTFSRNDALTRHMRVVHPEIDFPGKNKKRGGKGA